MDTILRFERKDEGSIPSGGTSAIFNFQFSIIMKKSILFFFLIAIIFIPIFVFAQGLVPCGNASDGSDACTINDFFTMLVRVYEFIVKMIATPLAVIALIVGAIFMMVSAGDPGIFGKGREIIKWAIIGLFLVWGSFLIIDFILKTIGFLGNWSSL